MRAWGVSALLVGGAAGAEPCPLAPDQALIGQPRHRSRTERNTHADIARQESPGFDCEILAANRPLILVAGRPAQIVRCRRNLAPGSTAHRESSSTCPMARLYYFRPSSKRSIVENYPISVGQKDWKTPLGVTKNRPETERSDLYTTKSGRNNIFRRPMCGRPRYARPDKPMGEYAAKAGPSGGRIPHPRHE